MTEITVSSKTANQSIEPQPPHSSNFIRFLTYVKPYKWMIVKASVGGIVKFSVPLIVPTVTRYLLDEVYLNNALTTDEKLHALLLSVGGLMLTFVVLWVPFTYMRHYYAGKASQMAIFDLRHDLYYKILRMSTSFFDRNKSGSIVSRIISDIELAQNLIGSALTDVWMDFVSLVLILYFLLTIDVGITLAALLTFPFYLYYFRKSQTEIKSSSLRVQEEIAAMAGSVQERIVGNRVVHSFTREKFEEESFNRESQRLLNTSMRRVYLQSVNITITGVITSLAPLIVTLYGGYQVITGHLTVGELVAVGMYLTPLYTPMQRFAQLNLVVANSMAAVDRVFEVLDESPEIRDKASASNLQKVEGCVEFHNVSFAYPQTETDDEANRGPVLNNVSFCVEPGEKIALVGPSGSGKSTIASLIPRFYDVDSGSITVDGIDIRDVTVRSLRRQVGMVLQTPILFSGSIYDNILYGRPDAAESELVDACKAANVYDFIRALPKGFGTEVGESGGYLSGGQRQRLTIARAFLKNPKVLILDEATSALDTESEKLIQVALEKLMEGRTTFIIAHRLSTIEKADRIFVLRDGRIVETGTHTQLLANGGIYYRLYNHD
ncbi:MAG: ABC transporter ATP-binding protein/permease [Anaerolineae bacterium]|nr:ABC transporter ATP-binding protein/permease [Anaerolineae bacterium]